MTAATEQAQLLLQIDASTEILRREVARATQTIEHLEHETGEKLDKVAEHFEKLGEKVKETATEFAKLGAEILIGQSIKEAIERAIEYSEALNKTANQLGVTTTFLQEFRFAATNSAVSAEAADKSLAKYSVTLGRAADGNKTAAKAFSDIGVHIADASGNLRPAEAIFRDVADAIKGMKSPAEQAAAAVAIFGRGGQSLLPILQEGAAGFDKMADAARKAGLVLGSGAIDRLEELSNATKNLKAQISTQLAQVISDNTELLLKFGEAAGEAARKVGYLLDQARGARYLSGQGRRLDVLMASGDTLASLGKPQGQLKDAQSQVRQQQAVVAGYATQGPINSTDFGRVRLADARKELAARQARVGEANDALLAYNLPANHFTPKEGDEGKTGGKVKPIEDDSAQRARDAAQAKADAIAAAAERRLEGLKNEVGTLDASIVEARAKLAGSPEALLAAQVAGEQAKTDAAIAKQKVAASDDTTTDQRSLRARAITDIRTLGDERIAALHDAYDREHAATLASLEEGNAQELLANRSAAAALIKDDTARAAAEIAIANDTADLQIAAIQREIDTSKKLTAEEIEALKKRQAALAAGKTLAVAGIERNNQGPLQDYLDTLPDTATKVDKAFQGAAVDGLKAFDDGLTGIISGTEKVGDAAKKMIDSIIADLARLEIEKEIIGPLAGALGLGGGGGGLLSGLLGGLFGGGGDGLGAALGGLTASNSAALGSGLAFANGGDPPPGMASLVGERGPELFVPRSAGTIVPNHALGGSTTTNIYSTQSVHFDVGLESVDRRIAQAAPVLLGAAQQATVAALKNAGIGQV